MGGIPKIVGPGYISGGNIWRFPNVSLHASAAQLEVDTYSNLTFTLPPLVQNRHLRNVGTQLTSFDIKMSAVRRRAPIDLSDT